MAMKIFSYIPVRSVSYSSLQVLSAIKDDGFFLFFPQPEQKNITFFITALLYG